MIVSFSKNMLPKVTDNFIIGCEGGFSQRELKLVDSTQIVGLKNKMILVFYLFEHARPGTPPSIELEDA